ncbi:MAG: CHAD domain-containing protein [Solirubrobacteraceae bacterium]
MSRAARAKVDVALAYDQRADAGAVAVLRSLLGVIVENLPGALDGSDPEYLHQLRIAVRRSRTVQRQLRRVFPALELPGFRSEFRWLQRATSDARDLDVYVDELDALAEMLPRGMRGDLAPLRPVLAHGRLSARAEMAQALRSARFQQLLGDWEQLLESLLEMPRDDRPAAARPLGRVVGKRIGKVYGQVITLGEAIDESSAAPDYHELRKKGKELRYLLELFALKLFDDDVVAPAISTLKGVQDLLGRHQDREVQTAMLRSLAEEVATLPGGPAACMAMGVLVDRLTADELAARRECGERFAELGSASQRTLFRDTFQ